MKKAIAREGMTYSAYRQKIREELGKMRLVSREIKSKIVIEEETLRKSYQENLDKFTDPLEVKIQQIFFPLPAACLAGRDRRRSGKKPSPSWKGPEREKILLNWPRNILGSRSQ